MDLSSNLNKLQIVDMGVGAVQIFVLLVMAVYLIFSFVLTRRIRIMNLNLKTPYSKGFIAISWMHSLASLVAFLITLLSLKI